jgi:hypothetical protein
MRSSGSCGPPGTCWVVLGDTYGGSWGNYGARTAHQRTRKAERWERKGSLPQRIKPPTADVPEKCLLQIPARFAIEMTNRGWTLRNQIVWKKPNGMPSSAQDRLTVDYEFVFFFVKSKRYSFDLDAIREPYQSTSISCLQRAVGPTHKHFTGAPGQTPQGLHCPRAGSTMARHPKGRNKRCVWTIAVRPFHEAHFATFPSALIETPIKAGCPPGGIVLDPFLGSGTTAIVARALGRRYIGIELNPDYIAMAHRRLQQGVLWATEPGVVEGNPPYTAPTPSLPCHKTAQGAGGGEVEDKGRSFPSRSPDKDNTKQRGADRR